MGPVAIKPPSLSQPDCSQRSQAHCALLPYCIWGVANFVPVNAVVSVSDLIKEPALCRMERLIHGINPGAGISRFLQERISRYSLGGGGYHTGTEADCFDRFEAAYGEKRWVVVPLWHT